MSLNPFKVFTYKSYPTPLAKVYWPFLTGMAITVYLTNVLKNASGNTDEFINHPKHPRFARGEKPKEL